MAPLERMAGVLAPVVTPFKKDLSVDSGRFISHCQWLLDNGCAGLAVFGTNSEANSLSVAEKINLLDELVQAGIPASKLMPGTGSCSLPDAVQLTSHAAKLGSCGVLMLPPFYYKGVSDEGLYRYFGGVIESVANASLRVYLYHIPPVSQVPISLALTERLLRDYPGNVVGLKDSSGDWSNTQAFLTQFASTGFDVFAGSEVFLLKNMRNGGKGCITATGNVNPGPINAVYQNWQAGNADELQAKIDHIRQMVQKYPMIPALKAIIAHFNNDADWRTVRPPLVEMTPGHERELIQELSESGFKL
ncbi:MAG TPA: dihydrodipicolinate synthase family protein [Eoetvoesiella sp.]